MWTFISRSIPEFDYTRLEPCTYWAEEDTNNNNIGTGGGSIYKVGGPDAKRRRCQRDGGRSERRGQKPNR